MINGKEIGAILIASVVMAFSNSYLNLPLFLVSIVMALVVLLVYSVSKKLSAHYFESKTEEKVWSFQRFGLKPHQHFNTYIPIGVILPFILSIISLGYIKWFAVTETEIKPTIARAAKRHDFYSYSELTEWHVGLIPAGGIVCVLVLSFIAYLVDISALAKMAIYFSFFNMIPIGNLDGTKILFGSRTLYFSLLAVVLIAVSYALMLV